MENKAKRGVCWCIGSCGEKGQYFLKSLRQDEWSELSFDLVKNQQLWNYAS